MALYATAGSVSSGRAPSRVRTVPCCAESRMPQMAKVSEAYHRPGAVQWAFATVFQEKEAVMIAVMVMHCA